jgi:hypothetical protein
LSDILRSKYTVDGKTSPEFFEPAHWARGGQLHGWA